MEISQFNNITYIKTNNSKFKTNNIIIKFVIPIDNKIIADATVLNDLMVTSCNKYNTIKSFSEKMYELYDLNISSSVSTMGNLHISEINFNFIMDEYLNESIEGKVLEFINEVIFNPNLTNEDYLKLIKEKRILAIKNAYDDKMSYCIQKLREELDPNKEYLIDVNSNEEDINNVNLKSLNDFYKYLISKASITVMIDCDEEDKLYDKLKTRLNFNNNGDEYDYRYKFNSVNNFQFISKTQNLSQSKFAIGCKVNIDKNDFEAFSIFNAIYGGFPFSRLFVNIREKQSLAYTINSVFSTNSNILYIYGGIGNGDLSVNDANYFDKILIPLRKELDSLINGDISEVELKQAKSMIINRAKSALDIQTSLQNTYYSYYIQKDIFDINEFVKQINNITKEDVVRMAKKVYFDKVFLLRGDK
ncbi:MAG: M16 family metallopeptidase [Bacilli bacterium]